MECGAAGAAFDQPSPTPNHRVAITIAEVWDLPLLPTRGFVAKPLRRLRDRLGGGIEPKKGGPASAALHLELAANCARRF
jgi:hypothetical protein